MAFGAVTILEFLMQFCLLLSRILTFSRGSEELSSRGDLLKVVVFDYRLLQLVIKMVGKISDLQGISARNSSNTRYWEDSECFSGLCLLTASYVLTWAVALVSES